MYTTTLEMDPVFNLFAAVAALVFKLWSIIRGFSPVDSTDKLLEDASETEISDSKSKPEDPNEKLASQLKGRSLTWTAEMLSMFEDLGWPALDMDRKQWPAEHEATYQRLKLDMEHIFRV